MSEHVKPGELHLAIGLPTHHVFLKQPARNAVQLASNRHFLVRVAFLPSTFLPTMGVPPSLRRWFDVSQQPGPDPHPSNLGATPADIQAMARIGRPQKLVRQFKGVSMWSFAITVMVSYITFTLLQATVFPLGGPPLLFWSFFVGAVLFAIIYYAMSGLIARYVGLYGATLQLFVNHYVLQESTGRR